MCLSILATDNQTVSQDTVWRDKVLIFFCSEALLSVTVDCFI